ncbi:hypothetical protein QUA20_10790 [Microcoleus sp. Pol7_A1]
MRPSPDGVARKLKALRLEGFKLIAIEKIEAGERYFFGFRLS